MAEDFKNINALVISDEPASAHVLLEHLKCVGVGKTQHITNGVEALRMLVESPRDLVVVDTNVKFISGWLLVRELKTSEKVRNLPVVLAGSDAPASTEDMKRYGVVEFFKLPGTASEFLFCVNSTLSLFRTSGTLEDKYTKAKAALLGEKTERAVALFSEIRDIAAKDTRSSVGLAQAHVQAKDVAAADVVISEMKADDDAPGFALVLKLRMLLSQDKAGECGNLVNEIISLTPDSPFYYFRALKVAFEFDAVSLVETIAVAALSHNFSLPDFAIALCKCRFANKDYASALSVVTDAVRRHGASDELLNLQGACLRKCNRFDEAIACYEHALKLSPMDHKIYFNLAVCAQAMGQIEMAKNYISTCLKISPGFKRAEQLLSDLEKARGLAS